MKKIYFLFICIAPLLIAGCKTEGPFERAGKQIDEKVEDVREDIDEIQDRAESQMNRAQRRMNQNSNLRNNRNY